MQAARALCAEPPLESVTIDDLVNEAGVAKGTFYGISSISLTCRPQSPTNSLRSSTTSFSRFGCNWLTRSSASPPAAPRLSARRCRTRPGAHWLRAVLGRCPRWPARLAPTCARICGWRRQRDRAITPDLGFQVGSGILLQAMRAAGERRLSPSDAPAMVEAILRALGIASAEAHAIVERVFDAPGSTTAASTSR